MAVTVFDGAFSFQQDSLARLGDRANTKEEGVFDATAFKASPFMMKMGRIDQATDRKMSTRDKARAETDPTFEPSENDFSAPKSFKYDKTMDYYRTLGIHEYATHDDVKKAFKRLSLTYHPDKTHALPKDTREEYAHIFIELKNASATLSDNATRRQYDRDRDKDQAAAEIEGWKIRERSQFDAAAVQEQKADRQKERAQKAQSVMVEHTVECRLEKFIHGGQKPAYLSILLKDRYSTTGFSYQDRTYRIDLPKGAKEGHLSEFKQKGSHHKDKRPDTLVFKVGAKEHELLSRRGNDLHMRFPLEPPGDLSNDPIVRAEAQGLRGRHVLLWGNNPFAADRNDLGGKFQIRVHGQGLGSEGRLLMRMKHKRAEKTDWMGGWAPTPWEDAPEDSRLRRFIERFDLGPRRTYPQLLNPTMQYRMLRNAGRQRFYEVDLYPTGSLMLHTKPACSVAFYSGAWFDGQTGVVSAKHPNMFVAVVNSHVCSKGRMKDSWAQLKAEVVPLLWTTCFGLLLRESRAVNLKSIMQMPTQRRKRGKRKRAFKNDEFGNKVVVILGEYDPRWDEGEWSDEWFEVEVAAPMPEDEYISEAEEEQPPEPVEPEGEKSDEEPKAEGEENEKSDEEAKELESEKYPSEAPPDEGAEGDDEGAGLAEEAEAEAEAEAGEAQAKDGGEGDAQAEGEEGVAEEAEGEEAEGDQAEGEGEEAEGEGEGEAPAEVEEPKPEEPGAQWADWGAPAMYSGGAGYDDWEEGDEEDDETKSVWRTLLPPVEVEMEDEDWGNAGLGGGAVSSYIDENSNLPGWQSLALQAYWSGDFWLAAGYYDRCLEIIIDEMGEEWGKQTDEYVKCLSNRAGCFAKLGQYDISRQLAQLLIELKPMWPRAWSRLGQACEMLGEEYEEEALSALSTATELDPSDANIDMLVKVVEAQMTAGSDEARRAKEKGVAFMVGKEFGKGIVAFTTALAVMPQVPDDMTKDGTSLLKAVLLANRSAAFAQLGRWESAIRDADVATVAKPSYARSFCRLGAALLGKARSEEAYFAFSRSLRLEHSKSAQLGLQECLTELMKWRSVAARKRHKRCFMDMRRPLGSTRVYAMSDVHFDNLANEDWVFDIDDMFFQDDVLIVAGNLADSKLAVHRGLTALRSKFRRVFYTIGNNEMRIHSAEDEKYPDSLAKMFDLLQVCEELDVDTGPGAVCQGCFIVPLFSWYNAEFDADDPWPAVAGRPDVGCRFPIDGDEQVWRYMLRLNELRLSLPYHSTVITFSHFLPRRGLPFQERGRHTVKSVGCEQIDQQLRGIGSTVHVYGHSGLKHVEEIDGVSYLHNPIGHPTERPMGDAGPCLLQVWDGWAPAAQPFGEEGVPLRRKNL